MTGYDWLVFFHVLAAIVWVGGGVFSQVYAVRVLASDDERQIAGFARNIEWMGTRLFVPASLAVLILGAVLVWQSEAWTLGQTWIWLALVAYGISILIGTAFLGPESGKLGRILEERGTLDTQYQSRLKRILMVSRLELLMLVFVVFLMVSRLGA
ncbi:hypothetical protein BH23ACT4_BH23ACT4_05200 [soil metagenome]